MGPELIEIKDFLAQRPPFEFLPETAIAHAASRVETAYVRAGTTILTYGAPLAHLYIVRSGLVELYRRNGDLCNRIESITRLRRQSTKVRGLPVSGYSILPQSHSGTDSAYRSP